MIFITVRIILFTKNSTLTPNSNFQNAEERLHIDTISLYEQNLKLFSSISHYKLILNIFQKIRRIDRRNPTFLSKIAGNGRLLSVSAVQRCRSEKHW